MRNLALHNPRTTMRRLGSHSPDKHLRDLSTAPSPIFVDKRLIHGLEHRKPRAPIQQPLSFLIPPQIVGGRRAMTLVLPFRSTF